MTSKVYKTAQGKSVDLGTIMLQNEHTRAVGNMNVNARGDRLDSGNRVIETKNRQIQRQNSRTAVPASVPVHTSTNKAKQAKQAKMMDEQDTNDEVNLQNTLLDEPDPVAVTTPEPQDIPATGGGLAAAIARSKIVKQEKEKTARELAQSKPGVRKI